MNRKEIIKNLYNGNIRPSDVTFKKDSPIFAKTKELDRLEKELCEIEYQKYRDLFIDYSSVSADITALTAEREFIRGFKLAVQLMVDAIGDNLNDFNDITKII